MKLFYFLLSGLVIFTSNLVLANDHITVTDKGLVIRFEAAPDGTKVLRLEAVTSEIFRVSATSKSEFKETNSLMVKEDLSYEANWQHEIDADTLRMWTDKVTAHVNLKTAEILFKDPSGKIILKEKTGGGRRFDSASTEENSYSSFSQHFQKNEAEGIYGLGQHQAGLFNYRDRHVDLTQYNGVAVVPFMISTNQYGLLWDNNSITKFGDTRIPEPISKLTLQPGLEDDAKGLKAIYASDRSNPTKGLERLESTIAYTDLPSLKNLPEFDQHRGAVTWTGYITPEHVGIHTFKLIYSGYIKITMNNQVLMDTWRESWNPGFEEFDYDLSSTATAVKIEWIPESDQSFLDLSYLKPLEGKEEDLFGFASEAGEYLDYYFIYGEEMDDVISGYRTLTGKAKIMPKWVMGFWQSRERYKTQEELLETVRNFREKQIPLDNIVQDWSYWEEDAWGSHEFDKDRFPDPEAMIKEVHDLNARIMISVWPKFYEGIDNNRVMDEKGMLYRQNIVNQQKDWIGEGYVSTFYDAFNPAARSMFWDQLNKRLFSIGIDAWWLDATEPDIHSNASISQRKTLMDPTALGSSTAFFNAYSLVNAKGIYEGQRKAAPDQRVFILTRSAFAGIQRYSAATWSGDIASRFDEMERQIAGGLNFSLSGLPYWTTDIGGFFVEDKYDRPHPEGDALDEWRELNTRWTQFGAFTPLFRAHGQYPHREIYNIAPEEHPAYQSMLYYNKLRYRLMPYIYSITGAVYHEDNTIMRPLVMDFKDPKVRDIGNQYMFGPSIMVTPVTVYQANTKAVYLPKHAGWYDMYSGKFLEGEQTITAEAPYERMPLFIKAGAIIPFGSEIFHTAERMQDEILLFVYAGNDGEFCLYDDGHTDYAYENGQFDKILISYSEQDKTLKINERVGKKHQNRVDKIDFKVIVIDRDKPKPLDFDQIPDFSFSYTGEALSIKLNN